MATLVTVLLLDSWQVLYAQGVVDRLHSYDLEQVAVRAEAAPDGLRVECTLRLTTTRPGPLRFLLSGEIDGLEATLGGAPVPAIWSDGGLGALVGMVAPGTKGVPGLLTIAPEAPVEAGAPLEIVLRYRWRPDGAGLAYASGSAVQTHLSGFWLPTMADELFDAELAVRGFGAVAATGIDGGETEGWRHFRSARPAQLLALVGGEFARHRRGPLELLLPPDVDAAPDELLDDLAAVLGRLEQWFGAADEPGFRLVVEPRRRPSPSYCAGSFAVVHQARLPAAAGRARWLELLAHECAHRWWGHRVATPVLGRGGTWLREGLAQWCGIEVASALEGGDLRERFYRAHFRAYAGRADLRRRGDGALFANEVTLRDATYLHPARVPYWRGALVHRRLAHELGDERFREALRRFSGNATGFVDAGDFADALGVQAALDYYVHRTRLPDLEIADVSVENGRTRARILCRDPLWPGGRVPCRIASDAGATTVDVVVSRGSGLLDWPGEARRIEIDPERIHLDPIRSNNRWPSSAR